MNYTNEVRKPPRKASPSRGEATERAEKAFSKKLEEIRRSRSFAKNDSETVKETKNLKSVQYIINGKKALSRIGDWVSLKSSSSSRNYYFNLKTFVNQWAIPDEWKTEQEPDVSSSSDKAAAAAAVFKMTLKNNATNPTVDLFESSLGSKDASPKSTIFPKVSPNRKRQRKSSTSSSSSSTTTSTFSSSSTSIESCTTTKIPMMVPPPSLEISSVLVAKAKIESVVSSLPNPTWITEYTFPALLSRCLFPKAFDALQELAKNRCKKRLSTSNLPPTSLNSSICPKELQREIFLTELIVPNNRYRLLTDKLGCEQVYKIPDELWERNYSVFKLEITHEVSLECRPHGVTQSGTPVYMRTGKVASKTPFPEDIVRCHCVVQAFGRATCHLVYANKNYEIARDDSQWSRDVEEAKEFLRENGDY